jgi:hypothetical protein
MNNIQHIVRGFSTAEARWARFGPYYAMFPVDFAFNVVKKYSKKGDYILDPFAGRCTSIYAGGVLERQSFGIEINPVGWLYGSVKINPASENEVKDRLLEIYSKRNYYSRAIEKMPAFYRMCYCDEVLKFLLSARNFLSWKTNSVDATLMSIILVYLHGKLGEGLSNQMKMSKAMGINYSIDWWKRHKLTTPPQINPCAFILKKIEWRYKKGTPKVSPSQVIFGDSEIELNKLHKKAIESEIEFSLLFTSPPYYSVTNYYSDQWLRLWLLGEDETPKASLGKYKKRFGSQDEYYELLDCVFETCSEMMAKKSTIYVRTDRREFTLNSTLEILENHFPKHKVKITDNPFTKKTQTEIHGNFSSENGEIDIIMTRK